MANNLAKVLKTDMPRLPLRKAAEELRKRGRGRDTMLAHITPEEAKLLKARGGRGTLNPDTGLPEFDFWDSLSSFFSPDTSSYQPTVQQPEFVQQPAFGQDAPNVDASAPIETGSTITQDASFQSPYGDITSNLGSSSYAPGYDPNLAQSMQSYIQANYPAGTDPTVADVNRFLASTTTPTSQAVVPEYKLTPEQQAEDRQYSTPEGIDKETMDRMAAADAQKTAAAKGIQTPFGTLGTKDLIAALGLGGLGLSYMNAQNQGKKAAQQLQGAYNQASAQEMALAQPYMQQGGTQLAQALTGALSPAQQQQLAAGQAAAAQSTAGSGGAAAAQAGRSVEDLRQRLLSNQQTMALQLLGAGTPLVNQAIRDQLAGTTTGINTNMQLSQQAGQAATGMLGMLAMMYGRG